jgi:outer membrane receptor protein involved in Fe transport
MAVVNLPSLRMLLWVMLIWIAAAAGSGGQVVDKASGRPIAGAVVTVSGAQGAATTGADGRFTWPDLPSGLVTIVVVLPGGRVARPIALRSVDPTADTRLEVDASLTEAVTVRGAAPAIDVAPGSSSLLVARADLDLRQPMTLTQSLELVPGVDGISEGQSATPAIRGLARGRTLVLVDGARVTAERGAGPSASFLDPGTVDRVDIARGPGSVAYGTDAFGGVIAARTRRAVAGSGFGVRFAGSIGAGLPEERLDLDLSQGYSRGAILVGMRGRRFDDYASPEGTVPHSSWQDAGVRFAWDHEGAGGVWAAGLLIDEATDVHRPRSDSNVTVATSPYERSQRFTVAFARPAAGAWRDIRLEGFLGGSAQRVEQHRLPGPGRTERVDRADSDANDAQIRATARRALGAARLRAGADFQARFDLSSTDAAFSYNAAGVQTSMVTTESIERAHRMDLGLFGEVDVPISDWIRLSCGVRGDAARSVNEGGYFGDRTIRHQDLAGMAAAAMQPMRDLTVVAQVSRGFRDPTLTDRFSRGPVGRGFLEGNPDLEAETSLQWDVTARYRVGRVDLGAAWYRYDIRNLIERYLAAPDLFRMRNRGHARLRGFELDARVAAGLGFAVDVTAETSRGEDADTGAPLDDIAPAATSLIIRHAWRTRVTSYLRATFTAAQDRPGSSEVATPSYTLVDAAATWRIADGVELQGTFRNLLDESYYASAGPRWVWAPGRQAVFTVVLSR